jgi:phosphoribosylanthranilate isomerase
MTWVKICGITNLEDARMAVDAGADALGFVFYEKSPRAAQMDAVREIVSVLGRAIETVGVFVDEKPGRMFSMATQLGLRAVQWHCTNLLQRIPEDSMKERRSLGATCTDLKVYLVFPATGFTWVPSGTRSGWAGIFLDSSTAGQPGGTGRTFDWEKAKPLVSAVSQDFNVIVAGGLTPSNVAEAIRMLRPFGVDVASGVEAKPGKKDPAKVRAFISAVREADNQV